MSPPCVVVIDDDEQVLGLLREVLRPVGGDVHTYTDPARAITEMASHAPEVLLVDLRMPEMDGWQVMEVVRERWPHCKIVVLTAFGAVQDAVRAMKAGASDFLTKPVDVRVVRETVAALIGQRTILKDAELGALAAFWGSDLVAAAQKAAQVHSTVLLTGETGVGKELLADFIQAHGPRARRPYVKVNCPALSETLIESELFGHERGAFTNALTRHTGYFERADGGTLLLDEIADLPLAMQTRLLRVLQSHEIERVGGEETIQTDVRVLCATCQDLSALAAQGLFRQDLFYRINVVPLHIRPLRERPEAIPGLARQLLARLRPAMGQGPESIDPHAMALLQAHPWPGNLRELEHCLERACLLAPGPSLRACDLPWISHPVTGGEGNSNPRTLEGTAIAHPAYRAQDAGEPALPPLNAAERRTLREVLAQHDWNFSRAATALSISRSDLYLKTRRYGISRPGHVSGRHLKEGASP